MDVLFPRLSLRQFIEALKITAIGALIAGMYGSIHDQISFTISPEYFTKMKYVQFGLTNSMFPPRWNVAYIGVMATWWVGLIGGWLLARLGIMKLPPAIRLRRTWQAFAIVVTTAAATGAIGVAAALFATDAGSLERWRDIQHALDIEDLRAFMIVAFLHEAGYIGAVFGILIALIFVRRHVQ